MAKNKVFWITMDEKANSTILLWQYKSHPFKNGSGAYISKKPNVFGHAGCPEGFTRFTGITLKPGERVKARLVIKE